MAEKKEEVKETIEHYGYVLIKEQIQVLNERTTKLEGVVNQVVAFLDRLEKVETEPEPVKEEPVVPKKGGWLSSIKV